MNHFNKLFRWEREEKEKLVENKYWNSIGSIFFVKMVRTNRTEESLVFTTSIQPHYDISTTRDLIVLIIVAVLIITINGLITISFLLVKKLRQRPANIMICSQACTDLFNGIVYIPNYLICTKISLELRLFLASYMLCLSLFNLLIISIDRYLALAKPFLHRRYIDVNRTTRMIALVWTIPLVIILIPLTWWFCDLQTKTKATNVYICTLWILLLVLVLSMTVLYTLATKRARKTIKSRRTLLGQKTDKATTLARKELRVAHLFGLLLFFFAAAYLPILYINFCFMIGMGKYVPLVMETISLYLLTFNSVLNPVLCILLKRDYLKAIKKIFLHQHKLDNHTMSLTSQNSTKDESFSRN